MQIMVLLMMFASCVGQSPDTRLVGSSVSSATEQLRIRETSWQPGAAPGYEVSCASERKVTLFGRQGTVCLIRRGDTLAALDFLVDECTTEEYDALRTTVIESYGLTSGTDRDVYAVLGRGVVHLRPTSDGGARLVLTDTQFGELYVTQQLREGFSDLTNGMRPH